jgi:hypothetical protein
VATVLFEGVFSGQESIIDSIGGVNNDLIETFEMACRKNIGIDTSFHLISGG